VSRDPGLDPREHRRALVVLGGIALTGILLWCWFLAVAP
jgi:hypothetical protein